MSNIKLSKPRKKYWWRIETWICKDCKFKYKIKILLHNPTYAGKRTYTFNREKYECIQCNRTNYFKIMDDNELEVKLLGQTKT